MTEKRSGHRHAPSTPVRRRTWWTAVFLLFAAILAAGIFLGRREYKVYVAGRSLQEEIDKLDRDEPGWRFEEWFGSAPPLSDEDNGALVIRQVRQQLPKDAHGRVKLDLDVPRRVAEQENEKGYVIHAIERRSATQRLPPAMIHFLRGRLQDLDAALGAARRLKNFRTGQPLIELNKERPWETAIPDMEAANMTIVLLRCDLELACHDGQPERAAENLLAILAAGRTAGARPFMLQALLTLQHHRAAVFSLERALGHLEFADHTLHELEHGFEAQLEIDYLPAAMRGERASGFETVAALADGRLAPEIFSDSTTRIKPSRWPRLRAWYERDVFLETQTDFLRYMSSALELIHLPRQQRVVQWRNLTAAIEHAKDAKPAKMILAHYVKLHSSADESRTRTQAAILTARVGLAVERYRTAHGDWPDALQQLCPRFLDAVPADPFSNDESPLRYRRRADGVVVYSIGSNGLDDEGHMEQGKLEGQDIAFRLYAPENRRPPPMPR